MVNVFVKVLFIALTYLLVSDNAHANYTPPVKYQHTSTFGSGFVGSKDALCAGAIAILNSTENNPSPIVTVSACADNTGQNAAAPSYARYDVSALYKRANGSFTSYYTVGYVIQLCDSPNIRVTGYPPNTVCSGIAPPVCPSGEVSSSGYYDGGKSPTASFPNVTCKDGCSVMFQGTWPHSQSNQPDGMHYYAKGSYVKDGFTCSGSTSPTASSTVPKSVEQQAADAAAAQAAADKAAKAAADKAAADAKTAADKAASAAAAQAAEAAKQAAEEAIKKAEASKAAAGSTSADPNATQAEKDAANAKAAADKAAADAAKDAAATAVGVAAAAQKDDTKPEPKDFCEKNPTSFICKTSAVNTGYCAPNGTVSGFSCDSDPVFCSMAQTQLQAYCLQNSRDEALVSAYDSMKTENGSNSPADSSKVTNINLPTSLNASSPYGAQCNPDVTVHVASSSVTLPFSAWCPYLNALGYLFLTMAYISAAIIISRT